MSLLRAAVQCRITISGWSSVAPVSPRPTAAWSSVAPVFGSTSSTRPTAAW